MRFKIKNKEEWHEWFAWYPVTIKGHIVWLETVQRRKVVQYDYYGVYFDERWEYDNLTSNTD